MFIVIEGIDGSGTTTQCRLLCDHINSIEGSSAVATKEPTDGPIGRLIRNAISSKADQGLAEIQKPDIMALLFAADRLHHKEQLMQYKLKAKEHIVSDRYFQSSIGYQAVVDNRVNQPMYSFVHDVNQRRVKADFSIFVDTPVLVCLQRMAGRSSTDIYENKPFLMKSRELYTGFYSTRAISDPYMYAVVNGDQPPDLVFRDILDRIRTARLINL